ncbi:MAG: apolipoprotein N-acyltransferase [Bacteroidetes bacterium]|nr:MAG: apolipoprotein N-acyltransferase [Bacteroidota bacterium]
MQKFLKAPWQQTLPLSGLLMYAAWPTSGFPILIFIALVPLLILEASGVKNSRFFVLLWLNMLVWNFCTTWWIWNASPGGAVGAILCNSLLMCLPWMVYRFCKQKLAQNAGFAALVVSWVSWEYLHHNWDLSWPWLTLGNAFATQPQWVRWYAFTGTTGGTVWVLLINILVFTLVANSNTSAKKWRAKAGVVLVLALAPMACGLLMRKHVVSSANGPNIVVVQPNVEPYTEKFNTNPAILINRMIALAESQINAETGLVLWPETAIPAQVWENEISNNEYYAAVFAFCKRHPQVVLLTGIDSYKNYGTQNPGGFSTRQLNDGSYYEAFNTAMATDSSGKIALYHKSKLVPGVETLPSWLGFLGKWFSEFGGISGSLGRNDSAAVFSAPRSPYVAAPIICYESIYGDYVTQYVRKGANVLTIITNDAWWGNTPGYKQHMSYARLRAIETGLWIARSANTGISCFISPAGEVFDAQPWDKAAAIRRQIPPIGETTFYSRHGDWISRLAWPLALILLLAAGTARWWQKKA